MANKKQLIDANAVNAEGCETTKIKTHFAQIIVDGTAEKPCYSILYFDPTDREYHIGFSSYCLEFVFKWLLEEFEIVEAPTIDAVEVVHAHWGECDWVKYDGHSECVRYPKAAWYCSNCRNAFKKELLWKDNYCPNCGAKMDGDSNG